jgi:hypothetical protein
MEKWLRTGTLKRKASDASETNSNCETSVVMASKCDSAMKVEVSSSNKKYNRKYDISYLELGFTWCGDESEQKPQCVLCYEVLSNECMKPAKLRRHLETKHCDVKNKPIQFSQRRLKTLNCGKDKVSAKTGKPHSIGENLLLPAIKDVVKTMFGHKFLKYIDLIPLSNDTVGRRINDMAGNVESQLIERIKQSPYYALQIDETTDVTNDAN